MSGRNNGDGVNRRTVLKSVGAGAGLFGLSGISAARTNPDVREELARSHEMKRVTRVYMDDNNVQQALLGHGEAVREQLAAEGIDTDLDTDEFDEVRTFPDERDGTPTAHIVAERNDGVRKIEFHVFPQADEAFAFEKTGSGLRRFEANDVKPAVFCETDTYCTNDYCWCSATTPDCEDNCDGGVKEEEECCTYSDGSTDCEIVDRYCTEECAPNC